MNSTLNLKTLSRLLAASVAGLLTATHAGAQAVNPDTGTRDSNATTVSVANAPKAPALDEDIVQMSVFQVDSKKDKGYFAENTLAGSRMRTNISDLGAAISVVTKQQLEDTASLDINDIFRYELGTEGATTYTPNVRNASRPGGVFESIAGNNIGGSTTSSTSATANRVRGLGSPSFAINYYQSIAAIPFDSYNAASFEINRGPNSMLFGMGSPAGIVNLSTAQALINKNTAQVSLRVDDRGSNRASFNFNTTLIKDKLAIYGAFLYNDQQFERKPSYDITRRLYGAITYKPFKGTKISASIEGYSNDNRRPNSLSPIDGVSEWRAAGMPIYDAKNHTIVSLASGETMSMYAGASQSPWATNIRDFVKSRPGYNSSNWKNANGTADPTQSSYNGISIFGADALTNVNSVLFVPGMSTYNARTIMRIAADEPRSWYQPLGGLRTRQGAWGSANEYPFSTTQSDANYIYKLGRNLTDRYDWYDMSMGNWTKSNNPKNNPNYPVATPDKYYNGTIYYPGVTDSAIYNWKEINILSMNFGNQRNTNYNVEVEQEILPGLLQFSAGWFRQDSDSMSLYNVGSLDATTLMVDTNLYNSDGTPNPYVGRPYVRDETPDRIEDSWAVDQYRAMLAFTPDFTKNQNWTKWLGRHQIMGLASYMDSQETTMRRRLVFASSDEQEGYYRYTADSRSAGWALQNGSTFRRQFYLDAGGTTPGNGSVKQAAGRMDDDPVSGAVRVFDYNTGTFKDINMTAVWNPFDNGTSRYGRTLLSYSGGWTAYLWDDRIVTTLGVRRDINKTRNTSNAGMTNPQKWVDGEYQYDDIYNRWQNWNRLAGTTSTMGAVVKPFLHWKPIAQRSGNNLFWEFIENFGFNYNKSDNFDAPAATYVDPFGTPLPKPEGTGKDYGVQTTLFKNKLYARVNWFESDNKNTPYAGALDRLINQVDTTAFRGWLEHIYMLNQGGNPSQDNWAGQWTTGGVGFTQAKQDAMKAWVADRWMVGVPNSIGGVDGFNNYGMIRNGSIRGTTSTKAKGVEVTVNYNPMPNWTIKLTATKVMTSNANTTKELDAWKAVRQPLWDGAKATDYLNATGLATLNSLGGVGNYVISSDPSNQKRGNITDFWHSTNYLTATNATPIKSDDINGWTTVQGYYDSVYASQYALQKDLEGQQVSGQRKYSFSVITNYAFNRGVLKGWAIGGAQRWADKAIIGYYGKDTAVDTDILYDASDVTKPIYDKAMWYTDLWVSYTRKIFNDKVRMKLQLNVADVFQDGELQPIAADWLGKPYAFRIVDSRQFILSASFDF